MNIGPLSTYMSKNSLKVWQRSGMIPPSKNALTICIRCIIAHYNQMADVANSNGSKESIATPFYVQCGVPGQFKADAVRRATHKDSMIRPFPLSNLSRMYVTERTVTVNGQQLKISCVADMPDQLYCDQDDLPKDMSVRPDSVASRLPITELTLDVIIRNRLVDLPTWSGPIVRSLPVVLDQPHQALSASVEWPTQFQWPSKKYNKRAMSVSGQAELNNSNDQPSEKEVHNAQCFVFTLPLHEAVFLLRYLLSVQDPMLPYLMLGSEHWPEDSKLRQLTSALGNPSMFGHLCFYLMCARYHFAHRCIALLRTDRLRANNTQTQHQQNLNKQGQHHQQATSHYIANVDALLDTTMVQEDDRAHAEDEHNAQSIIQPVQLLEQLDLWANALLPMIGWYLKRHELKLSYSDEALLCTTPHAEQLRIVDCLDHQVGTQQRNCTVYNTWYEIVIPAPKNFLRAGDTLYAQPFETIVEMQPSYSILLSQAESIAHATGIPTST